MKRQAFLSALVCMVLAMPVTSGLVMANDSDDQEPELVVRLYDVTELIVSFPDYPARKVSDMDNGSLIFKGYHEQQTAQPHLQFGGAGGLGGGGGMFSVYDSIGGSYYATPPEDYRTRSVDFDSLMSLITEVIEPESWQDVGGAGTIAPFPDTDLVITQTEAIHEKVDALLAELKKSGSRKNVTIEADWVELSRDDLELLLVEQGTRDVKVPFGLVDEKAWKDVPIAYSSVLTGQDRKTVSTVSGNQEKAIVSVIPVVGEYAEDAQTEADSDAPQESQATSDAPFPALGFQTDGAADDSADSGQVEGAWFDGSSNDSSYTLPPASERGVGYQPVVSVIQTGMAIEVTPIVLGEGDTVLLDVKTRQVEEPKDESGKKTSTTKQGFIYPLDHSKLANWHFATTLRLPTNKRILIGGMDSRYLFIKVTVE